MRALHSAFGVLLLVGCGSDTTVSAPRAPVPVAPVMPDAAVAPTPTAPRVVTTDAGAADAAMGGLGGAGTTGAVGGDPECGAVPDLAGSACAPGEPASPALERELERFLRRVAGANTAIASERADVVRARQIQAWQMERTDGSIRARVAYDADRAGTYRDTRGSTNPVPVFTGRTHHCVDLVLARVEAGYALAPPPCLPGLGFAPAFRSKTVP